MAEELANADLVGFSSVTMKAEAVEEIIAHLRVESPKTFIVWGGAHGIMAPESAIEHADAVCTGEGEDAFQRFLDAYGNERDHFQTPNFWFRKGSEVVKPPFLPLISSDGLGELPPQSTLTLGRGSSHKVPALCRCRSGIT